MNKQELQTMIDSTIVPNKKKGITAESLRLVLKEMASATNEGGGTGNVNMVTIYCPTELAEVAFNEEAIEALINAYEEENATFDLDKLREQLKGLLKKNAEAFKYIIENNGKKEYICALEVVGLEQYYFESANDTYESILGYGLYESAYARNVIPLAFSAGNIVFTDEAKEKFDLEDIQYVELCAGIGESLFITLNPDGSLLFEFEEQEEAPSSDLVKRIWFDELVYQDVSDEHKQENADSVKAVKEGFYGPIILCCDFISFKVSYTSSVIEAGESEPNGYVVSVGVFLGDGSFGVTAYEDGTVSESILEI